MGSGDADDVVTEIADQALQIHCDKRLILDDQYVGRNFGSHLPPGRIDQLADLGHVRLENEGHLLLGKAFQRKQQKGLTWQWRDIGQPALGRHRQRHHLGILVEGDRIPDLSEEPEQTCPRSVLLVQQGLILQQSLKHGSNVGVAGGLISRQGTGIPPQ